MSDLQSRSDDRREALRGWFSRTPGKLIADSEAHRIEALIASLYAHRAIQIGQLGDIDLLAASRAPLRTLVNLGSRVPSATASSLRGSATSLPIESDSVELAVLPHVLEFETHSHQALREVARVLSPEGHLVVTGFNPWSQFGAARLLLRRGARVPWCGEFLSLRRLRDWLALLGFDLCSVGGCFLRPPLRNESAMQWLSFVETVAAAKTPWLTGAYVVLARKRVVTLTPIRPRWATRSRLAPVGLAGGAAARTRSHG